jgi:hypothetical protein
VAVHPYAAATAPPGRLRTGVNTSGSSKGLAQRVGRATVGPLLLALPAVLLLLVHAWTNRNGLNFASGTVTGPDLREKTITLPHYVGNEPQRATYHYDISFIAHANGRTRVQIVPDDCIRSLSINGTQVDLRGFREDKLCDFHSGITLDVGRFLHDGKNVFSLDIENIEGDHGLSVTSVNRLATGRAPTIVLLVLLIVACFGALRMFSLPPRRRWVAAVLVAVAGFVRYDFVFDWHAPEYSVFSDMAIYVGRAQEILGGYWNESQGFQPLGYPLLLAFSLRTFGTFALVDWVHVLLGWSTVVLVWRASARWIGGWLSLVVLGIAALHYPFIALSGFFLAETVFTFLLALLFYVLARFAFPWRTGSAFVVGLVYMSALWFKGNDTFFGPLVVLWACYWVMSRPRADRMIVARRLLAPVSAFCAGAAIVVLSYAAVTRIYFGHARLSAPTSALNFVEGKCPAKVNSDPTGLAWHSPLFVQLGENEAKSWPRPFSDSAYFWSQGLSCIRRNPVVLATSVRYVYYLFFDNQLWPPNATQYATLVRWSGMLYSAVFFPGIVIGGLLIARRPRRRIALVSLMATSVVLCAWTFKSELRYRVPFDVVFIPMAVIGWRFIFLRLPPRRARARETPRRKSLSNG